MNLVSRLFFIRSIQWYKLFSDQLKNKEVRMLSSRGAILQNTYRKAVLGAINLLLGLWPIYHENIGGQL